MVEEQPLWERLTPEQRERAERRLRELAARWGMDVLALRRVVWRATFKMQREHPEVFKGVPNTSGAVEREGRDGGAPEVGGVE